MKRYFENYCVEQYEVNYVSVSSMEYDFQRYREGSHYESGLFYAEESEEYYCNIHAIRVA